MLDGPLLLRDRHYDKGPLAVRPQVTTQFFLFSKITPLDQSSEVHIHIYHFKPIHSASLTSNHIICSYIKPTIDTKYLSDVKVKKRSPSVTSKQLNSKIQVIHIHDKDVFHKQMIMINLYFFFPINLRKPFSIDFQAPRLSSLN